MSKKEKPIKIKEKNAKGNKKFSLPAEIPHIIGILVCFLAIFLGICTLTVQTKKISEKVTSDINGFKTSYKNKYDKKLTDKDPTNDEYTLDQFHQLALQELGLEKDDQLEKYYHKLEVKQINYTGVLIMGIPSVILIYIEVKNLINIEKEKKKLLNKTK